VTARIRQRQNVCEKFWPNGASGDENSFPVQLALLTKAQWRTAARLPYVVKDAQKQLEKAQASHRALFRSNSTAQWKMRVGL
jgi:hypothetical protein